MKTLRLSSKLLRATTSPLPFLLPAFSQSSLASASFSRQFSSHASVKAAAGTATQPGARTASATTATRRPPYSNEIISQQLGAIVSDARPRSNQGGPARSLKAQQESLADVMKITSSGFRSTYVPPANPPERLHAYLGRTVTVNEKTGLQGALRLLDMSNSKNRVKYEHTHQKFHERAGMKRKRLKRSRWAVRFKVGFKAMVAKVQSLKRMGW